jgi:flagellar motor protein MotB
VSTRAYVLILLAATLGGAAQAQLLRETPRGESTERQLPGDQVFMPWVHDPESLDAGAGDRFETREVASEELDTVKLTNLVAPIHFESGVAEIPDETVVQLRGILDDMKDRRNVRLHLVGHADTQPLSSALAAVFGDNEGLSRERAGEVAEFLKRALDLPAEAISYEWAGDTRPIASNATAAGRAQNRRVEVEVWYDVVKEGTKEQEVLVEAPFRRIKVCRMETLCRLRYVDGQERRTRVQNVVPPLHFNAETIDVTPTFVEQISEALANLSDRQNVLVKFVGYSDNAPLGDRNERIYGDQVGLSKARARRVALAVQDALGLATSAIDSDGKGAEKPLASNETVTGRALNRRVEVEFWYDDPLQELPDEPQLCPAPGLETVTRVYDPPWGSFEPLAISNGDPVVPAGYSAQLARALADVADKTHPRLRFVGYTGNDPLERRTALVYGDDIGLSASRARRAMEAVVAELGLSSDQVEFEGRGFVHNDDVVNAGFTQDKASEIVVQVVYDEPAELDDYDGVDVTPVTRELTPQNAFGLNLMRITVDGRPLDDPGRSSSDVQRCTDVALDNADIQFGFDNLEAKRRLAVAAEPTVVELAPGNAEVLAKPVRFTMYANYSHFIERAEVRIFEQAASLEAEPLGVVPLGGDGSGEWRPSADGLDATARELKFIVRAYGKDGNFDETLPQPLWLINPGLGAVAPGSTNSLPSIASGTPLFAALEVPPEVAAQIASAAADENAEGPPEDESAPVDVTDESLRLAYGENDLNISNIQLSSGSVTVRGNSIPPGHSVWVAGHPVPLDDDGSFVAQEILPTGIHTVEVAVLDEDGNGELYLRDLELEPKDWFYVGIADLTLSSNETNGPIELLQGENPTYDFDSSADARLAFYVNGKFGDGWKLAASADTRDAPLSDLFSNFLDKSPESLFRRIDPDYYYPTFGDDGTVEEMAPTLGKFYVKLAHRENYGVWGNFNVDYMNNELAQVDRGLYGGNLHYQSKDTTSFGERRFAIDGFAAEPGTIGSFEEFRGTGGSLYYLRRQDILPGSERVRVELRDRVSGLVTGVVNLTPSIDYDIDYLQGRVLLSQPLASTAGDDLLVRSNSLQGDEAYLVVRYEYTPGFDDVNQVSVGAQGHYWFNERVKVGLTANSNDEDMLESGLSAGDVTVRFSSDSWFKLQGARTEGLVMGAVRSNDGGFGFNGYDDALFTDTSAGGYRADVSLGLGDFVDRARGRLTLYTQSLDAGYSAPGLATLTDTQNYGGTFRMPVTNKLTMVAKSDRRVQDQGVEIRAQELDVDFKLNENWKVSSGVRKDERSDASATVPLTQQQGKRTDAVVQVGYDSKGRWSTYGFVQDTMSVDGDREENARIGTGGSFRISEKLRIDAEVSDGDLGTGGKFGTNYMHSDRTSMYLNYALENERTDNGLTGTQGAEGSTIAGVKTRLSDSSSVYLEERHRSNAFTSGLTHATGINLAPTERLNLGATADFGTLVDALTGAETQRRAAGFHFGYGFDALQLSSGIEYRSDETQALDLSLSTRETWLFRNSFKYQMGPDSRLIGKLNLSDSTSSLGQFYDGAFTEAVLGYAFRPVRHNRLNALVKYTYFYNLPTTDQITLKNLPAEFIQKSHVAGIDLTYDVSSRWSIGGKYAYRTGEVSLDREDPVFFDNTANLYIVRADFRFMENWEGMLEGRLLDLPDVQDSRSGTLIVISRRLGDHLKVGAGYNFTDFTDDLTDLSFDNRGVFLNMTGAL